VLGAVVAAARLLDLDRDRLAAAVAIAASTSSGLRQNFGSMVKPLHAGHAAFHGVGAAELSARGFTGSPNVLDGPLGFGAMTGGHLDAETFAGDRYELLESGLVFKRYTCCGAIHAALDALLELRAQHGLAPAGVRRIRCAVNRRAPQVLVHRSPSTGDEGRFSLEHALAVALADGAAELAQFDDERVADPALRELYGRVEVVVDERLPAEAGRFPAVVTVETVDGASHSRAVDEPRGFPANPLTEGELADKFRGCAGRLLDAERTEHVLDLLRRFDRLDDVSEVARAAAPLPEPSSAL
jgi:2-methylcitrate dehydratase PrpD